MLSLVSYGSSGESEDEENSDNESTKPSSPTATHFTSKTQQKPVSKTEDFNDAEWEDQVTVGNANDNVKLDSKEKCESEDDLLSKLPPPVTDLRSIPWDQLSKLTYKSRAIRIMAPSIPEEVEEKKEKKLPSKTGSGLLAMLPKPRNQFLATPSVLKPVVRNPTPAPVKPKLLPKPKLTPVKKSVDHESDSDGENDDNVDFFSLTSAPEVPQVDFGDNNIDVPLSADVPTPSKQTLEETRWNDVALPARSSFDSQKTDTSFHIDTGSAASQPAASSSSDYVPFQQANDELQLDNEALEALCGSRGRKRKGVNDDEFRVIDINGSQLTPDAHELLTKNLTTDQPRPKRNSKDGPTSQQKRKHQIIYLAHQAKEQELELQNTWSNNRMSKKQTQAKYGF